MDMCLDDRALPAVFRDEIHLSLGALSAIEEQGDDELLVERAINLDLVLLWRPTLEGRHPTRLHASQRLFDCGVALSRALVDELLGIRAIIAARSPAAANQYRTDHELQHAERLNRSR